MILKLDFLFVWWRSENRAAPPVSKLPPARRVSGVDGAAGYASEVVCLATAELLGESNRIAAHQSHPRLRPHGILHCQNHFRNLLPLLRASFGYNEISL